MEAVVHTGVTEFEALTRTRYAQDPVWHTVAIGVLHRLVNLPQPQDKPVMVSLHEQTELVGSILRTPPWPAMLTDLPREAVDLAVATLREADPDLPGVIGPTEPTEAFATRWSSDAKVTLNERLYRLQELEAPEVPGTKRRADENDLPLLARWRDAFYAEALPSEPQTAPAEEIVRRFFALDYGVWLWEVDGTTVAWAMASPVNAGMSRVGPVYTPPEHRRRGYGAAVTAAATSWAQSNGAEHVVLFADLLNPISNSIYQRIGYREVCDWIQYHW